MKLTLLLLLTIITASHIQAGEPDYRSYFSHPDVKINIRIGTAHSEAIPFKNHTVAKTTNEVPGFQCGFGTSGESSYSPNVHWRFIQKTEFGDLYLIDVKKRDSLIQAIPVLYTGSSLIAYNRDRICVVIEPL